MSGSVLLESIVTRGHLTRRDSHSAIVTSQALDWPGVRVEAGRNDVSAVDDLVGDQHYLSLNLDRAPRNRHVVEYVVAPPRQKQPGARTITMMRKRRSA